MLRWSQTAQEKQHSRLGLAHFADGTIHFKYILDQCMDVDYCLLCGEIEETVIEFGHTHTQNSTGHVHQMPKICMT